MSDENQDVEISNEASSRRMKQVAVKMAREVLNSRTVEYLQILVQIEQGEAHLRLLREEAAAILREHPFLGNINGVINKEAVKTADQEARAEEELFNEIQEAELRIQEISQAEVPESKEEQAARAKALSEMEAKKGRRRLLAKMIQQNNQRNAALRKFHPDHPARA